VCCVAAPPDARHPCRTAVRTRPRSEPRSRAPDRLPRDRHATPCRRPASGHDRTGPMRGDRCHHGDDRSGRTTRPNVADCHPGLDDHHVRTRHLSRRGVPDGFPQQPRSPVLGITRVVVQRPKSRARRALAPGHGYGCGSCPYAGGRPLACAGGAQPGGPARRRVWIWVWLVSLRTRATLTQECPAASYSPTPSQVQYHRRCQA
jgi:hypothetical protein